MNPPSELPHPPRLKASRERVIEAEGVLAGMLYATGDKTMRYCQSKASSLLDALRSLGWERPEEP